MPTPKRLNFFHYLSSLEKFVYGLTWIIFLILSVYSSLALFREFESNRSTLFPKLGILVLIGLLYILGRFQKLGLERGIQKNPKLLENFEVKRQLDHSNIHLADINKLARASVLLTIISVLFSILGLVIIFYISQF